MTACDGVRFLARAPSEMKIGVMRSTFFDRLLKGFWFQARVEFEFQLPLFEHLAIARFGNLVRKPNVVNLLVIAKVKLNVHWWRLLGSFFYVIGRTLWTLLKIAEQQWTMSLLVEDEITNKVFATADANRIGFAVGVIESFS